MPQQILLLTKKNFFKESEANRIQNNIFTRMQDLDFNKQTKIKATSNGDEISEKNKGSYKKKTE